MKRFLIAVKIAFQIIKCFNCEYKEECPHSIFLTYKAQQFRLSIEKVKDGLKNGK